MRERESLWSRNSICKGLVTDRLCFLWACETVWHLLHTKQEPTVLPYSNTVISTLLHQGSVRTLLVSCWVISRPGSPEANYPQLFKHEGLWNSEQGQALRVFPITPYSSYPWLHLEHHHEIRTRGRGPQVESVPSVLISMKICPISHWVTKIKYPGSLFH